MQGPVNFIARQDNGCVNTRQNISINSPPLAGQNRDGKLIKLNRNLSSIIFSQDQNINVLVPFVRNRH